MDYLEKLNPEERAWIERFSAEFYKNATKDGMMSQDQRRERWRAYMANRRDATTHQRIDRGFADDRNVFAGGSESIEIERLDYDSARSKSRNDASLRSGRAPRPDPEPPPVRRRRRRAKKPVGDPSQGG